MVAPLFTKEHIDGMRPHIQETVNSLLDAMIKEGDKKSVDLVEKFALPVASYVSCSACDNLVTDILIRACSYSRQYMESLAFPSKISHTLLSKQRSEAMVAPQPPKRQMPMRK